MSLFITSLNSGSNGNCYYVGNSNEAVLIDAGISCREIEKRMKRLGLCMQKLKAVFVSHEHSDHIRGIEVLSKKFSLPIYITSSTLLHCGFKLQEHLVKSFTAHEPIVIGDLTVSAFPKCHDACDPYSFLIGCNKVNVGVFTDIGEPCQQLVKHFKQCHAAFLEANYDTDMLMGGSYPYYLKKRISGGNGHLSNRQALDLFIKHKPSFMSHLFLSHLSQNNNCPKLVNQLFNTYAGNVEIIVASRYEETGLYQVSDFSSTSTKPVYRRVTSSQLAFSFT